MRTQPHGIHLLGALVSDPGFDDIGREDVAFEQKRVIRLQGIERLFQRGRGGGNVRQLFRRQLVNVLVQRLVRIDQLKKNLD